MIKEPNKNIIFQQIDNDLDSIKKTLKFIKEFSGNQIENIRKLTDRNGEFHIKGGGIFFITQLLAGSRPDEYVVLEENISKSLNMLGITDILVKNDTANGYVYINEICKKIYKDKLKDKLKKYEFGLEAVHNLLWHYYVYYRKEKKWYP